VRLSLIIAVNTLGGYTNEERLDKSFKATLYPVYDSLIRRISNDRRLDIGPLSIVSHMKTDNFRYGRGGGGGGGAGVYGDGKSEFDDRIDAIDIKDLRLKVKNVTCR